MYTAASETTTKSQVESNLDKNKIKADELRKWFTIGLLVTVGLYLVFHFWLFEPGKGLLPVEWYAVTTKSGISKRALDWTLWGLAGTFIYLLTEIAKNYPLIKERAPKNQSFLDYSPWYVATLVKGPFIVLVIMLFFNAANLQLTGGENNPAIAFDFSKLDHRVTVALAFVLGFYSRVGRNVLDGIVKTLLPKAWAEAYEEFEIEPSDSEVVIGESMVFKTSPQTEVVWAASLGTIDATGKYIAPTKKEDCGKKAIITAVSTGTHRITQSATATIVPFKIEGQAKDLEHGKKYSYSVSTQDKIKWSVSNGTIKDTGEFTAPEEKEIETVTITATIKEGDKEGLSNSLEVKFKTDSEEGE